MTTPATLSFLLMDAPYEQSRTATAFRLIDAALRRGHGVRVFAYEGAVSLAMTAQKPHANAIHGRTVEEEAHPTPHLWVSALLDLAKEQGVVIDWVNCGLCVDERGATDVVAGVRRGSPADFWKMASESENTLVIATR
ncbi:MAG TPA: DsrE family protein [Steroidobacteraceae bacterium]|nr:DsrE family protein [Steroidobacteraceae bacterium]